MKIPERDIAHAMGLTAEKALQEMSESVLDFVGGKPVSDEQLHCAAGAIAVFVQLGLLYRDNTVAQVIDYLDGKLTRENLKLLAMTPSFSVN